MSVEVEAGAYIFQPEEVFSHNPLHDLESLWWVGVWLLVCHYHTSKLRYTAVQQHIEVVKTFAETLFNNRVYLPLTRRHALIGPDFLTSIDPGSFPVVLQHFILSLDDFRIELVKYYERYKPMASQDRSFFKPDLFFKFSDIVEKALKKLGDDQTGLWPIDHIKKRVVLLNANK